MRGPAPQLLAAAAVSLWASSSDGNRAKLARLQVRAQRSVDGVNVDTCVLNIIAFCGVNTEG